MSQISFTIDGADSQHRSRIRQRRPRLFPFPDGVERLIVTSTWHWETYDRLKAELGFSDDEFAWCVLNFMRKFRKNTSDFEAQLRVEFEAYIHCWNSDDDRAVNTNNI